MPPVSIGSSMVCANDKGVGSAPAGRSSAATSSAVKPAARVTMAKHRNGVGDNRMAYPPGAKRNWAHHGPLEPPDHTVKDGLETSRLRDRRGQADAALPGRGDPGMHQRTTSWPP